jgi:para-nitrobenzyl esterase
MYLPVDTLRLIAAAWLVAGAFADAGWGASLDNSLSIKIESGTVVGVGKDDTRQFLGIPYAAPPIGPLRWRPPRAAKSWNTYRADTLPSPCPQNSASVFARPSVSEDCLYLNVFAPAQAQPRGRALPVMVWLHGGGLFSGSSADYDGSRLARDGHVIVVTLNYRLGALGFFSHPAINAEPHDAINYGLMDQQFALKWVQRNIASFGGNASLITLFGQSSGATSVLGHLISPKAKDLIQRAIIQSGTHMVPMTKSDAVAEGISFANALGCVDQSSRCLRRSTVEQILEIFSLSTEEPSCVLPWTLCGAVNSIEFPLSTE